MEMEMVGGFSITKKKSNMGLYFDMCRGFFFKVLSAKKQFVFKNFH